MFDSYRKEVPATLVPFGGRFIVRGGNLAVLEGEWPHPRLVIIEFPSCAATGGWYTVSRISKSDLAEVEQLRGELDHR
jgi:uncharacterized protein (DUF1330 family)